VAELEVDLYTDAVKGDTSVSRKMAKLPSCRLVAHMPAIRGAMISELGARTCLLTLECEDVASQSSIASCWTQAAGHQVGPMVSVILGSFSESV